MPGSPPTIVAQEVLCPERKLLRPFGVVQHLRGVARPPQGGGCETGVHRHVSCRPACGRHQARHAVAACSPAGQGHDPPAQAGHHLKLTRRPGAPPWRCGVDGGWGARCCRPVARKHAWAGIVATPATACTRACSISVRSAAAAAVTNRLERTRAPAALSSDLRPLPLAQATARRWAALRFNALGNVLAQRPADA